MTMVWVLHLLQGRLPLLFHLHFLNGAGYQLLVERSSLGWKALNTNFTSPLSLSLGT